MDRIFSIFACLSLICISTSQIASPETPTIPTTQNITTVKTTQQTLLPITTQQPIQPITNFNKEVLFKISVATLIMKHKYCFP